MKRSLVIALAHFRMLTSKVRRFRGIFFLLMTSFLIIWGIFLVPPILSAIVPDMQYLGSILLPYVGGLIDYIFALLFAFFIMYQLSSAFQNLEEGQHELLLATPTKEGDIFLGEYLGRVPIYTWGIMFIVPLITGLLQKLFAITPLDVFIITLLIILLIGIAAWIGSIITGFVVKKAMHSARGKDIGKAFTFIIAIIFVVSFYIFTFLSQDVIANPAFRVWMQILPSSWFGNIVNSIIGAPLVLSWFNSAMSLLFIVAFSLIIFVGGYRLAPHFYSMDIGGAQVQVSIIGENAFFHFLRRIMPQSWATLVVTNLKNYLRRKENISKLAYAVVITVMFVIIQFVTNQDMGGSSIITSMFPLLFTPWMFALLLGTVLGSYIFVHSKDVLWIYKQSPRGIRSLVQGNLIAMVTLSVPLAIGISIFLIIATQLDLIQGMSFILGLLLNTVGALAMTLGIGSLNPAFKEKSGKMAINTLMFMGLQMFLFISLTTWFFTSLGSLGDITSSLILNTLIMSLLELGIGIPVLYLGIWHLEKVE